MVEIQSVPSVSLQVGTLPGGELPQCIYGSGAVAAHLLFSLNQSEDKKTTFGHYTLLVEDFGNTPKHMDLPAEVSCRYLSVNFPAIFSLHSPSLCVYMYVNTLLYNTVYVYIYIYTYTLYRTPTKLKTSRRLAPF